MCHTRAVSITRPLGTLVQRNSTRIILALTLGLLLLCVAIKSTKLDAQLSSWIQRTERVDAELQYVNSALGGASEEMFAGTTSQLLLQTPRQQAANVLTVESLMIHLEAMAIATHVTVDLYDVTWSLKDLCYTPTLPDYEGISAEMLEKMIPCAIKTPLDCFWEGAKLLGPKQPVTLGHFMGPIPKWTSLNPMILVGAMQRGLKNSDFPFQSLMAWMNRVGISTGYQHKPCLDPTDPNCPTTAPNKFTGEPPNIGAYLTGGCRGLAENQWHWKEEEIVGGIVKNKTGHIVRAGALQSTIQLMGDQDMYDYWRRTNKVVDINNWSVDKAKLIMESWQNRFKEELAQFTRTSVSSRSFKIHAMTSKLMNEPIDKYSLLDLTTFELCFFLMTIYLCICFPRFRYSPQRTTKQVMDTDSKLNETSCEETSISRWRTTQLAIVASSFVGLTFIASLGLSSFMNLPFNMATTQILPPLALYYGFNQVIVIANIYAQRFKITPSLDNLTTECLNELLPIVRIESLTYISALLAAAIIPIEATRVFAFQAISYIVLTSLATIILIPSIFTYFLLYHVTDDYDNSQMSNNTSDYKSKSYTNSSSRSPQNKFLVRKTSRQTKCDNPNLEEQIFSRLDDDLRNINADMKCSADINLSVKVHGRQSNFHYTTTESLKNDAHQTRPFIPRPTSIPLPDLIAGSLPTYDQACEDSNSPSNTALESYPKEQDQAHLKAENVIKNEPPSSFYAKCLTTNRYVQVFICLVAFSVFVMISTQVPRIRYGLTLKDIVARGTSEYEPMSIQEKYFPVYNIFMATKSNFDYPTNQKLLHELYNAIEQVDGIVKDGKMIRFWLVRFRSWLLELQQEFDNEYSKHNKSDPIGDDWFPELSDTSKLAYKLLAQTGRIDNPIDRNIVETNRLVDANGIINPKAFYYYLTAWVIKDPFSYAFSEASFKPEPKIWDDNQNNLKIEKARPLLYAQIPFLMELPANHDNLKTISEIRSKSQAFEQLNLPNFPTGIPFVFWDQFLNLDLLFLIAATVGIVSTFVIIELSTLNLRIAAIMTLPILLTELELCSFMGYAKIPFNDILAVLLISAIGLTTIQTNYYTTYYMSVKGQSIIRTQAALNARSRAVLSNLGLFIICALTFQTSKFDFIIKYSYLLLVLGILNSVNSLLLTPIILCLLGPESELLPEVDKKQILKKPRKTVIPKMKHRVYKKRGYPRVQSEISLSTISEEPQLNQSDFKLDFSIKCY